MKWCVCFPEEDILIKRPCLRKACLNNHTGAAFLSFLLYQVSISKEYKQCMEKSMQPENETQTLNVAIDKTQREIISGMDNEISDRTLRDTAIPLLIALGYIDVDESDKANTYTIHLAQIQRGINTPPKVSEFLLTLQHLINDRNTSTKWQKYFLRLSAMFPTHRGKSTDDKKRARSAYKVERIPSSSDDKREKKNNDPRKIQAVAIQTEEVPKHVMTNIAAPAQPSSKGISRDISSQKQQQSKKPREVPQSPDSAEPRTAQTVLQLIEFLRGHSFCETERLQQTRAATILMSLQPELRLEEIKNAWLHGSDEYWRRNYDQFGMTVTDLVHHNSHGKRRVIAVLEHKQRQERASTHQESNPDAKQYTEHPPSPLAIEHPWSEQIMTEQEAQQLAIQATNDGQDHHYNLTAYSACEQHSWVVKVHIEHHVLTIHSPSEWSQAFAGIHEVLQMKKQLSAGKRELVCIK